MAYYKRDQLSIKTRTKLADYFADLIVLTQSLEAFRVQLAQIQFFDGVQLFRYLDHEQKGFLAPKDFGILVSEEVKKVLHYAFGWFDSSKAGQITKIQFLQFLYPRRNPQLRQLVSLTMQQQLTPQQKQLTIQSQLTLLRQLILQLMQRQTKLIPIRRYLMDQHDYSIKAVMNCLDVEGRGWISTNDLYKFMRNFDIDVSIQSVHGLVGVCDRDYNGKISMEELDWLVEGLQRSDSAYRNIVRNTDHKVREKRINSCCTCKRNLTSQKKTLKSHKKQVSKTDKKQNRNQWLGKTNQKSSNRQTLREKLNFDSVKHTPKAKETTIKQTNQVSAKTTKSKRVHSTISKQANQNSHETYNALKRAFEMAEQQTLQIDKQLRKYEQQMKIKAQLEMQSKLEQVRHKKKAKKQQKQKLRRRIEQLEAVRIQQKRIKDEQERMLRMRELETDRLLQIQLQKNRIRQLQSLRIQAEEQNLWRFEAQRNRLRQIQIMKQAQFREMELRKQMQIRQMQRIRQSQIRHKQYQLRIAEEQLKLNQVEERIRNKINFQTIQRQHQYALFRQTGLKVLDNHFDYEAQARLKALHAEEVRQRSAAKDKLEKETEYYSKYSKYCNHLAQIGDPLGIKEHIAETDKYLRKSKLLREEIKKDRVYSLNRYEGSTLKGSQRVTQRQKTLTQSSFQRTPVGKMNREGVSDKKNESTKVKWSNS